MAVLSAVVATACGLSSEPESTTVATTTTTLPATTTTIVAVNAELAVADEYFAAFNVGDSEVVMALFTPDATFAFQFTGNPTAEPMTAPAITSE